MKINKMKPSTAVAHVVFILFSVLCVFPMIILISSSLTSEPEYIKYGLSVFPKKVDFTAYKIIFMYPQRLINAFSVSAFITAVGTALNLLIIAMVAYPLTKPTFKYRRVISFYLYFTMLFSGGLIPYYILISKYLHMNDSVWVLVVPLLASPWHIFLMRTYFSYIPASLFESAKIDGASEFTVFAKILLPLSSTAIATCGFMIALGYWNEWYHGMLFINDSNIYPLQMLLQNMLEYISMLKLKPGLADMLGGNSVPSTGVVSATCFVVAAPMMFVFVLFQKYYIQGITAGAVKE